MVIIGEIIASEGIESSKWLALIKSHGALAHVPPRIGINPFTRQPIEFNAPASTAIIWKDGADIGSISWAMDGAPIHIVEAQEQSTDSVASVAEDIAGSLGGQFVRRPYQE
jgi:hypothetical protein